MGFNSLTSVKCAMSLPVPKSKPNSFFATCAREAMRINHRTLHSQLTSYFAIRRTGRRKSRKSAALRGPRNFVLPCRIEVPITTRS